MTTYIQRRFSVVAPLLRLFDTWIARRRAAKEAYAALSAMSDRELHDIGIARSDIERVAKHDPLEPGDIRRR